jgi:hypothetical protein
MRATPPPFQDELSGGEIQPGEILGIKLAALQESQQQSA